ncbi:MAG: hypothetical protein HC824_15820 [Synechococcales cyanobacterium RM1_1_8]|nr:hypothetical protein [Synechococcales cyanobacterium RM1_1_8]
MRQGFAQIRRPIRRPIRRFRPQGRAPALGETGWLRGQRSDRPGSELAQHRQLGHLQPGLLGLSRLGLNRLGLERLDLQPLALMNPGE